MATIDGIDSGTLRVGIGHAEAVRVRVDRGPGMHGCEVEVITGLDGRFTVVVTGAEYRTENRDTIDGQFSDTYRG